MQTFLYKNDLPSKEPITTWILTGEEPDEWSLPFPNQKPPYNFPKYCPLKFGDAIGSVGGVESWRYRGYVAWIALNAYWAWCVGKPLVSHRDFAFVCRAVQQMECDNHSLSAHLYPLEAHCPYSWSPCRQTNYAWIPSRYPAWIRNTFENVPLNPVTPVNDARADPNGWYKAFRKTL